MKEIICIVCPNGCHLITDGADRIEGYKCERGLDYAKAEMTNPTRVLTSTIRVVGGIHRRCSVKTDRPISKVLLMEAMERVNSLEVAAPVECGHVLIKNIMGTEANLVTTREVAGI
ncbi:molybdopterin oxidoreductase [Synergistales bacterium]|nr:molybdopterin oxidoreductase [Synergistales bacterium]